MSGRVPHNSWPVLAWAAWKLFGLFCFVCFCRSPGGANSKVQREFCPSGARGIVPSPCAVEPHCGGEIRHFENKKLKADYIYPSQGIRGPLPGTRQFEPDVAFRGGQNEDTLRQQHCWRDHVSQMLTRFATRATFVVDTCVLDTKNVSENFQKHFLCPRGAQQCCHVLPRTGNIVGHNVAATMCPRFAGALLCS